MLKTLDKEIPRAEILSACKVNVSGFVALKAVRLFVYLNVCLLQHILVRV